jgi:UDP-glucose 4-epimerase
VQGAVSVFLGKALKREPITIWGDGLVARDYFYVRDAVNAFLCAVEKDTDPDIFNIASGRAISLMEIVRAIERVVGRELEVEFTKGRKLDVPVNCLDIRLAKKILGWQPEVSLQEGIDRTWSWLRKKVFQ